MEKAFTNLDDEEILKATQKQKEVLERAMNQKEMKSHVMDYFKDDDRDSRVKKNMCRACYYLDKDRVSAQMFTHAHCGSCGSRMIFPTSHVDRTCHKCAADRGICKHCGGQMD